MENNKLLGVGLLILRVAIGLFMLIGHGWPKLTKFAELSLNFPDPLGMGSRLSLIAALGAEVACSALLIIGLLTRIAAIPLAFTMIVALFLVHAEDPWQKKELAAVYLAVYSAIIYTGAGSFSLDSYLLRKKTDDMSTTKKDK